MPFLTIAMRKRPVKSLFATIAIGTHPIHFLIIIVRKQPTKKIIRTITVRKRPTPVLTKKVVIFSRIQWPEWPDRKILLRERSVLPF